MLENFIRTGAISGITGVIFVMTAAASVTTGVTFATTAAMFARTGETSGKTATTETKLTHVGEGGEETRRLFVCGAATSYCLDLPKPAKTKTIPGGRSLNREGAVRLAELLASASPYTIS